MTATYDKKGRRIGGLAPPPIEVDHAALATELAGSRPRLRSEKADFFRALSHPLRIALLECMVDGEEMSASDLGEAGLIRASFEDLDLALLSHHLRTLARLGLVRRTRLVTEKPGRPSKQMFVLTDSGKAAARMGGIASQLFEGAP